MNSITAQAETENRFNQIACNMLREVVSRMRSLRYIFFEIDR